MKVKLGSLYKISSGGTPLKNNKEFYDNGEINWVKTGDLKQQYLFNTQDCITQIGFEKSSAKMYAENTVLVAMYGATIGATSILKISACTNQACAAFPKIDKVIPEYLYYFMKSKKEQFVKDGVGGAQPNISLSYLKNVDFILTEVSEQKKIVEKLEKTGRLIDLKIQQLKELDTLIKSRFVEMFGDPESNTKKYRMVNLCEIAQYFNGLTYAPENVSDEGIIVLRSSNIQNSKLDFKDIVRVRLNVNDNKIVRENDILMCSRNGSAKLVGKVALIDNLPERMAFGAFMMIIRSEYYAYLLSYFQMGAFRKQITTGATTTINQITSRMLDNVKLPLPENSQVKEFELFVKHVDKLKCSVQISLDETQRLFDSLMQEYFG